MDDSRGKGCTLFHARVTQSRMQEYLYQKQRLARGLPSDAREPRPRRSKGVTLDWLATLNNHVHMPWTTRERASPPAARGIKVPPFLVAAIDTCVRHVPDPIGLHLAHFPAAAVVQPIPYSDRLRGEVISSRHVKAAGVASPPPPA